MTILTPFFAIFVASLTPGGSISGSVGHTDSIWKRNRIQVNGGGQFC